MVTLWLKTGCFRWKWPSEALKAKWPRFWEIAPPGQSGFIAPDGIKSPHYDDQLKMYETFGKKRMWITAEDVEKNKTSEVVLKY